MQTIKGLDGCQYVIIDSKLQKVKSITYSDKYLTQTGESCEIEIEVPVNQTIINGIGFATIYKCILCKKNNVICGNKVCRECSTSNNEY